MVYSQVFHSSNVIKYFLQEVFLAVRMRTKHIEYLYLLFTL
jgi:hypothetical protein